MKHRSQYTSKFKHRARQIVKESGKHIACVVKELDLKPNTLYNWHQLTLNKAHSALSEQY